MCQQLPKLFQLDKSTKVICKECVITAQVSNKFLLGTDIKKKEIVWMC